MAQLSRLGSGPILTREDIPVCAPRIVDPSSVFNPGAIEQDGNIHLMLRVQTRGRETFLFMAQSENGFDFSIETEPISFRGLDNLPERPFHLYDPRLTRLDGRVYALVAMDVPSGCRLGLAVSDDCRSWEFLGLASAEDNRNGVLFPERVGGRYARLDRPNRKDPTGALGSGREICLSTSTDLLEWTTEASVATGRPHFWDELIGPGPPPVKTRAGWLLVYHGIATHFATSNIYQAGAMLLDPDDPARVLARTRNNILEPREPWESVGQVPNVVFPTGLITPRHDEEGYVDENSPFFLYYGAADTCVGLAAGLVSDLLRSCQED